MFGKKNKDIFVLSSASASNVSRDIHQNIIILKYPDKPVARHDLALDFLIRLEPRTSIYQQKDRNLPIYKVFSTFERKKYLDAQRELEKNASAIKYCTAKFTNVFSIDEKYIVEAATKFANAVYKEIEKFDE